MRIAHSIVAAAAAVTLSSLAHAGMPPMGGPMTHIMVTFDGAAMHAHVPSTEPRVLQNYGEAYDAPADVLDGMWFNAQYGWMPDGFWEPPAGTFVWIEETSAPDALDTYQAMTFEPIFGTEGAPARWMWSGTMTHNWYAATEPGLYEATYSVYFGDGDGTPDKSYAPTEIVLSWVLPAEGDTNGDFVVDVTDLLTVLSAWGPCDGCPADVTGDGMVDVQDLLTVLAHWT